MKKALGLLVLVLLSSSVAHAQKQIWNLFRDIQTTGNQISFDQGANGVWYFMEASSRVHNPLTYRLLHDYQAPCDNWGPFTASVVGAGCWESANVVPDGNDQHSPFITVNFTYHPLLFNNIEFPARSIFLNPSPTQLAIVAWKSPIAGTVHVAGSFTEFNATCGNGVHWSVDKGSKILAAGNIASGGGLQSFDLSDITVVKGQALYFSVDSLGDIYCDEAIFEVTIAKQ